MHHTFSFYAGLKVYQQTELLIGSWNLNISGEQLEEDSEVALMILYSGQLQWA